MIKAIIFDCFGVLVEETLGAFYKRYFKQDHAKIALAEKSHDASNRGEITYEEFEKRLAEIAEISLEEAQGFLNNNPRNEALLSYIGTDLKQEYKIGFLSNASANWLADLFRPEDLALFDAVVLSYEEGYAKPEPQIYEIAAERLGVRLTECVFVDDRDNYLKGALQVGMKGILYKDFEAFKQELERVLS